MRAAGMVDLGKRFGACSSVCDVMCRSGDRNTDLKAGGEEERMSAFLSVGSVMVL